MLPRVRSGRCDAQACSRADEPKASASEGAGAAFEIRAVPNHDLLRQETDDADFQCVVDAGLVGEVAGEDHGWRQIGRSIDTRQVGAMTADEGLLHTDIPRQLVVQQIDGINGENDVGAGAGDGVALLELVSGKGTGGDDEVAAFGERILRSAGGIQRRVGALLLVFGRLIPCPARRAGCRAGH